MQTSPNRSEYRRFDRGPHLAHAHWPVLLAQGVMADRLSRKKAPSHIAKQIYGYFLESPEAAIQYALSNASLNGAREEYTKSDSSTLPQMDALIRATYREGAELYRTLGKPVLDVKYSAIPEGKLVSLQQTFQPPPLSEEHEALYRQKIETEGTGRKTRSLARGFNRSNEYMAGCLHVIELLTEMRRQSSALLLHEEGIMDQQQYEAIIASSQQILEAQGHMGIYPMAQHHPELDAVMHADATGILVTHAKGSPTHMVMPICSYTRAAYLASEDAFVEKKSWMTDAQRQAELEDSYAQSMGYPYIEAARHKQEVIADIARFHQLHNEHPTLDSLSQQAIGEPGSYVYEKFKDASNAYIGRHGIALMHPEITGILEKAGKLTPQNIAAIDHGFHAGFNPPYLAHIRALLEPLRPAEPKSMVTANALQHHGAKELPEPRRSFLARLLSGPRDANSNER